MSRREDIDNAIWSDPDFEALSYPSKLLYIWSFTNQRCGMAGIYRVGRLAVKLEAGLPDEALEASVAELTETRFLRYDGRVMWVRSRVRHLRSKSPSIAKSIARDLESVPAGHEFLGLFRVENADEHWLLPMPDTPSGTPRHPLDTPPTTPPDPPDTPQGRARAEVVVGSTGTSSLRSDVVEPARLDAAREKLRSEAVVAVFDAWIWARTQVVGPRAATSKLTPERRRLIAARLGTWPRDDLVDAVKGWRHSAHHRGENRQGTVYADLKLLLRDADRIETFRDLERQHAAPTNGVGRNEAFLEAKRAAGISE